MGQSKTVLYHISVKNGKVTFFIHLIIKIIMKNFLLGILGTISIVILMEFACLLGYGIKSTISDEDNLDRYEAATAKIDSLIQSECSYPVNEVYTNVSDVMGYRCALTLEKQFSEIPETTVANVTRMLLSETDCVLIGEIVTEYNDRKDAYDNMLLAKQQDTGPTLSTPELKTDNAKPTVASPPDSTIKQEE